MLRIILSAVVFLFFAPPALADCIDPPGEESKIIYSENYQVLQYCDGTRWIAMHLPGSGSGGCTEPDRPEGTPVYNATFRVMQACAGNRWKAMGPIGGAGGAAPGMPPTDGLLAHWKLDESGGTTASDSAGSGHDGTLVNGPLWQSSGGYVGGALLFDGVNDVVSVPNDPALENLAALTLAAWIYPTAVGQTFHSRIISKSNGGISDDYMLSLQSDGAPRFRITTDVGGAENLIGAPLPLNQWSYVAGTWDGAEMRLYVYNADGSEFSGTALAKTGALAASGERLSLGAHIDTPSNRRFTGMIDEAVLYDRALTAAEIRDVAGSTGPLTIITHDDLGADLSGSNKWRGGIIAADGKIYGIPTNSEDILIIDPATGTASRSAMGADLTGGGKWYDGVLGPDGKIYGIPFHSTDILIIDPVAGTATRSAMGANLSGVGKWEGGVLGPDGKIYGIPWDSNDILIIDPVAGTASRSAMGANLSGTGNWSGGALGPDGKIYGIPAYSTDILIIDPVAGTATRSAMGADLDGSLKWQGTVLGPDGKIYGMPRLSGNILIIDPVAGTATRSAMGANLTGSEKWAGGVIGPDGMIYGMPRGHSQILRIDPASGTAKMLSAGPAGGDKWYGGALGSDGRLYGIPMDSPDILIISLVLGTCQNPEGSTAALLYNADAKVMQYCDGASWIRIGGDACRRPGVTPGTLCGDGSFYIGLSPEDGKKVYMTSAAYETTSRWDEDPPCYRCGGGGLPATSITDGRANVEVLRAYDGEAGATAGNLDGFGAAKYCDNLTNVHGHSDWYLPTGGVVAGTEQNLFWTMVQAEGTVDGIGSGSGWYWSSSVEGANVARVQRFSDGDQVNRNKNSNALVWCVRR